MLAVIAIAAVLALTRKPEISLNANWSFQQAPRNCTAARAMGLQNIRRGSPFYGPWLDADNDGVACEPWPGRRTRFQ
jgi:hypothetical protein